MSQHELEYHRKLRKGIFFVLIAWFFFALAYLASKLIGPETSVSTMVFFRGLVGVVLTLPWMLKHKRSFTTQRPGLIMIRSLAATANIALIFLAVQSISLVNSTLLSNSAPLFVPFLILIFLRKPIDHRIWGPILLGLVGIVLVLRPTKEIIHIGAIYALGSGLCTAITLLTVRLTAATEKMHTVLFYNFLTGWIFSFPFAWTNWKIPSLTIFFALILLGIPSVVGQWWLFKSLEYGKASHIAPFSYICVVYSAIFDWIFFHQVPGLWSLLGIACVFGGGVMVLLLVRPKKEKFSKPDLEE